MIWLTAGAIGFGLVFGVGKMFHDWQEYMGQRQRARNPWDIG